MRSNSTMVRSRMKPIAYLNAAAGLLGLLYVFYVFYWISTNDGYYRAALYSSIFATMFIGYAPIRAVLLRKYTEKQVYLFLAVPFIIVFFAIHELAFGWQ